MRNRDFQIDMTSSAIASQRSQLPSDEPAGLSALKRRAQRGMAALFIRYGLALLISLAGTVLLSRLVGPEIWGAFAIAQVVYLSSQEILGRGIATHLIKQQSEPSAVDIGNTFSLQHLVGLVFLLGAGLLAAPMARWYSHREMVPLLLASALACYLYAWRSVPVALMERELNYGRVAVVEILDATAFCATAVAFVWLGYPVPGLAVALVMRSLVSTVAACLLRRFRPKLWLSRGAISGVIDFGSFVTASSVLNILILAIPALLGGWIMGIENVGQVQMAISLYSSLLFASAAILRLSFSAYSRLREYPGELQATVNRNLETAAMVLVPAVVLFAGLSPAWAPLVFGAKWSLLPALILAQAPAYLLSSVFWGIMSSALVVSGKHRQMFVFLAAFVAVYAVLTVVASMKLGPLGVPVAASTTHILLYPCLFAVYGRALGKVRFRKVAAELCLGVVFTALMWWAFRRWGFLAAPVAGLYLMLWYSGNSRSLNSLARSGRSLLSRTMIAGEEA